MIEVIPIAEPVAYDHMLERQKARLAEVRAGTAPNTLFILEHPAVITMGRETKEEHVLAGRQRLAQLGVELLRADRGGDVTYHGPGQLVAYPIFNLKEWRCSVNWYLRSLEEVLIRLLADYGLCGERMEGYTGAWVDGAKVAAVGVGLRHWITYHGISLNVAPNMEHFKLIVPCGIADKPVCSLAELLPEAPAMADVSRRIEQHFLDVFSEKIDEG
jgi:lipoyl(octanoyl) transferase